LLFDKFLCKQRNTLHGGLCQFFLDGRTLCIRTTELRIGLLAYYQLDE